MSTRSIAVVGVIAVVGAAAAWRLRGDASESAAARPAAMAGGSASAASDVEANARVPVPVEAREVNVPAVEAAEAKWKAKYGGMSKLALTQAHIALMLQLDAQTDVLMEACSLNRDFVDFDAFEDSQPPIPETIDAALGVRHLVASINQTDAAGTQRVRVFYVGEYEFPQWALRRELDWLTAMQVTAPDDVEADSAAVASER